MKYEYYTDGAATMKKVNGEYVRVAGGWSFVKTVDGEVVRFANGGAPATTNNAMELYAIYAALREFSLSERECATCVIYTDSAYSLNIYTQWVSGWERNGWVRGQKKEPIQNLSIIKPTWELINKLRNNFCNIEFVKVKGHDGNKYNEQADQLAVWGKQAADESKTISLFDDSIKL